MFRVALFADIVGIALDTLRANKLRSALTVLGIVIGITAIVGMSSLILGFDESLRNSIREMGPNTIFVSKFSGLSMSSGASFLDLMKRPNLTIPDARAIERAPSVAMVDVWLGAGGPGVQERLFYRNDRTRPIAILGTTEKFADINFLHLAAGRFFSETEVQHRRPVIVLGQTPVKALFTNLDPIGKQVRVGRHLYTVVGVLDPRPGLGGFDTGQDDIAVIPYTTYQKQFGIDAMRIGRGEWRAIMIAVVPREDVPREQAQREVEEIMRIRHGLRLDQPNDFDIVTQDAALKLFTQITQGIFLALVVISSIALMVGGIGVMAIMMISVTERTREIGIRKALGARRREILWQFILEAVVLTSVGGILGILIGSAIGIGTAYFTDFPISLPWWSFAIGFGFSAGVGIFFGLYPAFKASRLDPIEALRYE
ncbi:MAG: ABC transporter permease [Vicinamibacterales bacterium]